MFKQSQKLKKLAGYLHHNKLFSTTWVPCKTHCCKILVVGGGSGGCSIAAQFCKTMTKREVIIVEPQELHYYQPYFTLVGAGIKKIRDCVRAAIHVLPEGATWIKDSVRCFCPRSNAVILENQDVIEYDFMVVAVGVVIDFDKIKNLKYALENCRNVCTIYSPDYAEKTFRCFKEFACGPALFTAPNTPTKCLAAALKITFLAEHYFRIHDKAHEADITFCTGGKSLFPVKIYDEQLKKIAKRRRIEVNCATNLIGVNPESNQAIFECLNNPGNTICLKYSMLHVAPPVSPPEALKSCEDLVNPHKYMDVNGNTLQHRRFSNVFALGDCSPLGLNKSTSAIIYQVATVHKNIENVINGKPVEELYDGYTACPVVTSYNTCLLTEFNSKLEVIYTIPFVANKESRLTFFLTKVIMPEIYWRKILKGNFYGADRLRKIMNLNFFGRKKKLQILSLKKWRK